MAAVKGAIPNLINGVSQQAADTRLPSQAEACENFHPSLVDGLTPRARTDHLAAIATSLPAGTFTHFIIRDETEKYLLAILADGTVKVWDWEGTEKTVTNTSGSGYLSSMTTPSDELRALTVADNTFIVNKGKTVAQGSSTQASRPYEGLIGVLAGNYGKTYRVYVDGVLAASYTTPSGGDQSHSPWVDTVQIAGQLYYGLATGTNGAFAVPDDDANAPAAQYGLGTFNTTPWAVGRYNSTLYLRNTSTNFTLSVEDGYAGKAMKEAKDTVQKFADLPLYGPDGVVIKVAGDEQTGGDDYWVEFVKRDDAEGSGVWKECVAPGAKLGLDATTMPHVLVRLEDGAFYFGPPKDGATTDATTYAAGNLRWGSRTCGNEDTVPDPSFVGHAIQDVFFHKNRLGFLTEESYVLSGAGSFFQFYRQTLLALLDTDPIDGAASHIKVSYLRHAVPYAEELLLWSDNTQFRLSGNELLTPKTVNARPLSELSSDYRIQPVAAGSGVYFVSEGDEWASLYEYYYDAQIKQADDENTNAHAPSYVPAGVHTLVASPALDLAVLLTSGDADALYVYAFHWRGNEKLQSAWVRWPLPGVTRIIKATFDKKYLVLLVERSGSYFIERMNLEGGVPDTGLTFRVALDRSVVLDDGVYDSVNDRTAYTLPYTVPSDIVAVTLPDGDTPAGVEHTVESYTGTTVYLLGDTSADNVRFGLEYECRYRFSTLFLRDQQGQSQVPGRTQVHNLSLAYDKAAYFEVEVTPQARPKRTYPFSSLLAGEAVTGALSLASGKLSIPILSRNDRVTIDVVVDTWRPASFTKAAWAGTYSPDVLER